MSSTFYKSIIEDEMKAFGIKEGSLKPAAKSVSGSYSRKSLTQGQTFLDYNLPSNRCAYLFKYASIHTELVTKNFRKLVKKKKVKASLKRKKTLKICCLGGGPGTDIVGLFKVLALYTQFHKKVVEVTILDICGGWRNSFKRIIANLIDGKVKDVPKSFIDASNFKFRLLEVNLLYNLPANIVTAISEADIICMIKFVSAILGSSTSVSALQVIGEKLKVGAVVLFIDNFQGNVFKPLVDISGQIGLEIVLGPLHESFNNKTGYTKGLITAKEKEMFGCLPLFATRVTVLGFIKSDKVCANILNQSYNVSTNDYSVNDEDDSWDTEDESENSVKEIPKSLPPYVPKNCLHKFSQTDEKYFDDSNMPSADRVSTNDLYSLVDRLCDLVNVLSQLKQWMTVRKHCSHCHQ